MGCFKLFTAYLSHKLKALSQRKERSICTRTYSRTALKFTITWRVLKRAPGRIKLPQLGWPGRRLEMEQMVKLWMCLRWDGWMASPTQTQTHCSWVWANSGRWWRMGKPGVLQFMGSKELDTTEWLNNNNRKTKGSIQVLLGKQGNSQQLSNLWEEFIAPCKSPDNQWITFRT